MSCFNYFHSPSIDISRNAGSEGEDDDDEVVDATAFPQPNFNESPVTTSLPSSAPSSALTISMSTPATTSTNSGPSTIQSDLFQEDGQLSSDVFVVKAPVPKAKKQRDSTEA